ncbi:phospholipid/cholesterol/gamma-HCH transport system substrate-binding protein [Saccharomonospora amisosensis]|uniref:Phospholipid/cholesterol/gamma-HCH transport system substrate-binding protein n=1 Tax=Saccharomonospora amisosensis TaxID=1128677 RepID=A0A7X5UVE1_9PSEU|nr:MCE family protein [Saccharomonospora amisosensis]NIJ14898.1 phospholipid/cholesterol/gamma-HCH transport system substrate-binding protein [Saccharomonospora amisosensis]
MRSFVPALLKMGVFTVVTMLLTAVLAATIANANFGNASGYTARFSSASGLHVGDDVRIAGVKVGQVTGIDAVEGDDGRGTVAKVTFQVEQGRELPALVTATVKFRNLVGQRYLSLGTNVAGDSVLSAGGTIPLERTQPALDLTTLFNGFRPLLRALEPEQVNQLSYQLIRVLQGEGGTVRSLLTHIASVTTTVADRDEVIGKVIDNLNSVLDTVNQRSPQLGQLVDTTQQLVSGLARQREPIGEAVSGLAELTDVTAGLLEDARPPLKRDIDGLNRLAGNLRDAEDLLATILNDLPSSMRKFTRVTSYGSWFNYYLCGLSGTIGIESLNVTVPVLPLPGTQQPERCKV